MPWLQLVIESRPGDAARLGEWLEQSGALSVTFQDGADQPLYEPDLGSTPLWRATRVTGLFSSETDVEAIAANLARQTTSELFPPWRIAPLEDKDWDREWMARFTPLRCGRRLWIVPSWHAPPDPQAINILLDPGLAFGTGTHPTTMLCLEWLDQWEAAGMCVIDYGCGSGILALAAARLGASQLRAVDNDPQALIATAENAARNGVADRIAPVLPDALSPEPADLVLANILAGPLIDLAPRLAQLVRTEGSIVLSGILAEQAESVAEAYRPWFTIARPVEREGWVRLDGRRK